MAEADLKKTPLHDLHVELGARMVPFAGYAMPVQYSDGIMAEHLHTRDQAGLFDVSHMGQADVTGDEAALEVLITADLSALKPGEQKYTLLLNDEGGIMDDLMVSRPFGADGGIFVVVNAATKGADFAHMRARFAGRATLTELADRALLALQGPAAATVFTGLVPEAAKLVFMQCGVFQLDGVEVFASRSGYTGEDGFEISVPAGKADQIARLLLSDARVKPIGLGARDSLRLEAGLCLYGHDMDEGRTPVEAALTWAIARTRRERADFPGAARILKQIADGAGVKRVGIRPHDRAPAREGAEIAVNGEIVGVVTSGGFGPTVGAPVAMGYVRSDLAKPGTALDLMVRGKARPAEIVSMPFAPHRFHRG
ncbi:MAG: glycine cleavage system aminomethyltransferase GcvT [Oceanicaulis sp.]|uniref:glycine cleavage system aminomethyltransferase GcvT n=1 Tax=Glycocaulis sp. TaxID=1969725 RepID=UPI0025BBF85B|nr:glycine cleavage system aminomethyltransferase GcvT [Glycocaulis sp.]MCC5980094.1 glycine cleavage system aminomethyltransferase GcvT [Oceanicaulis sp.]MCH8522564.1 glycine cleavage system aminomethyltransferase GcvT [Glycocaulis sp.]